MDLQSQFESLKENWLLTALLVLAVVTLFPWNPNTPQSTPESFLGTTQERGVTADSRSVTTTSYASVRASNVDTAVSAIAGRVQELSGVVESRSVQRDEDGTARSGYVRVEVPETNRESFLDALKNYGTVTSLSTSQRDISEETTDLQDDLDSAREKLSRLNELYDEVSAREQIELIDSILAEERRIAQLERRLSDVEDETVLSDVTVNVQRDQFLTAEFIEFKDVVNGLIQSLNGFINTLVRYLPWITVAGLGYYVYKKRK
jgi:hypothetical protein